MSHIVMNVSGLGKVFRRYSHELYRVLRWFGVNAPIAEERWVLKDISFDVQSGQALGIVGRNGAGKSTLLKLITGTMRPSTGGVTINGKIAAILELGMGFNPDYTGRQNVFHALGLMGYQHAEIVDALDGIAGFSELGSYFDQPLRVYSSGMHMRLAFSVATAFRPDILIVDEALSVGDAYFQHKSFDRIKEFQKEGTTLILVSHDRMALLSLCDRAILLHNGAVAKDGDPEAVLDYYNALLSDASDTSIETRELSDGRVQTTSGNKRVTIEAVSLLDEAGQAVDTLSVGQKARFRVDVLANSAVDTLVLGFSIKDRVGQTMHGTNTYYSDQVIENVQPGDRYSFTVAFEANFGEGSYSLTLALTGGENHLNDNYEWRDLALVFSVANLSKQVFDGKLYLPSHFSVEKNGSI
ncbi:MAG: ABC transporter ATP-binding protein [Devosia sp.]|uniref:ABC transporter ATP-binding protein n=1 Tax=Devosia sp. TaxID=1871048 RepID=UPI0019EB6570|nr:ABC transporter ATP-binding protein [Devosia sp.]MBF0680379.1 ABC transporter ATP-binding protein [Devosia sp.]